MLERASAYLGVMFIQFLDGNLDIAAVNRVLNLLSDLDLVAILLGWQVGFLRELGGGVGIALHSQVVQDQSVDITEDGLANAMSRDRFEVG